MVQRRETRFGFLSSIIFLLVSTFPSYQYLSSSSALASTLLRDRHIFMTFWAYATKKDASAVHGELSQQAPYKTEPEIIKKAKER